MHICIICGPNFYICTLSTNYRQLYCIKQSSLIEFPVNPSDCCLNSKVLVIWESIIPWHKFIPNSQLLGLRVGCWRCHYRVHGRVDLRCLTFPGNFIITHVHYTITNLNTALFITQNGKITLNYQTPLIWKFFFCFFLLYFLSFGLWDNFFLI